MSVIAAVLFLRRDPLVARLISTPLPKESYQVMDKPLYHGMDKPEIWNDKPDPGQAGQVVFPTREGAGAFIFTVFKSPAQARSSYDETTTSDRARASAAGGSVINVSGITGLCLRSGNNVICCRALVGRTSVSSLFPNGESEEVAIASTLALVRHVSALER